MGTASVSEAGVSTVSLRAKKRASFGSGMAMSPFEKRWSRNGAPPCGSKGCAPSSPHSPSLSKR